MAKIDCFKAINRTFTPFVVATLLTVALFVQMVPFWTDYETPVHGQLEAS